MSSLLPEGLLAKLLPALGSLGRMAGRGRQPTGDGLALIAAATDAGAKAAALAELARWSAILASVHRDPSPEHRDAAVEALILRGVPEAPALLAVDAAAHGQEATPTPPAQAGLSGEPSSPAPSPPAPPAPPRFSVPSIDLGGLAARAVAVVEVSVTGGPATVASDSAFVQVEPASVGRESGAVRVTARLPEAGSLWATVTATGAGGAAALPVIARVAEPAAATAVSEPRLTPVIDPTPASLAWRAQRGPSRKTAAADLRGFHDDPPPSAGTTAAPTDHRHSAQPTARPVMRTTDDVAHEVRQRKLVAQEAADDNLAMAIGALMAVGMLLLLAWAVGSR
jgi:hypothetical protein